MSSRANFSSSQKCARRVDQRSHVVSPPEQVAKVTDLDHKITKTPTPHALGNEASIAKVLRGRQRTIEAELVAEIAQFGFSRLLGRR